MTRSTVDLDPSAKKAKTESLTQAESDRRASSSSTQIAALTGLRAIAALLIVAQHAWTTMHQYDIKVLNVLLRPLLACWVGVDLFFVLSGFLLTRILLASKDSPNYFRNFYARRCLRIWPLYYALLLGCTAFTCATANFNFSCKYLDPLLPFWWLATFTTNVFVFNLDAWFVNIGQIPFQHCWSLAVEEHFYLIWPLATKRFDAAKLLKVCLWSILAVITLRTAYFLCTKNQIGTYVFTPFRLDSFLAGCAMACILARYSKTEDMVRRLSVVSLVSVAAMAVLGITTHFYLGNPLMSSVGFSVIAIAFASVVGYLASSTGNDVLSKVLSSRALVFVGKYSYAIYLFHLPIATWLNNQLIARHLVATPLAAITLGFCLPLLLTIVSALLSWNVLEKHCLRLKVRFVC